MSIIALVYMSLEEKHGGIEPPPETWGLRWSA